jgi:primary-amine oxidase
LELLHSLTESQDRFHEAVVNLTARKVEFNTRLGKNMHGNADYDEILQVEQKTLENEQVKAAIAKLGLPKDAVVCADPWPNGTLFASL